MAMRFFNTNDAVLGTEDFSRKLTSGSLETVGVAQAIIDGQPHGGGLYMPTLLPRVDAAFIENMRGMSYAKVFAKVVAPFFSGVFRKSTLDTIAQEAYTFEPFLEHVEGDDYIARLDTGPTAAFKDYAAQALFRVVERLMKGDSLLDGSFQERFDGIDLLTYIVATSGDTGGATGAACHGRDGLWMAILHSSNVPEEVSELQAKQMNTLGDNVHALWVDTDFDGCHDLAIELQKDPELAYMHTTSANSINIGRLIPQIPYYFFSYLQVAEPGEEVYFSVPSGNFGDALGGFFAQRMGLPIKLVIALNENDVFHRFYESGVYSPSSSSIGCPSNAMIVNHPSNMRRLFQLYGGQLVQGKRPGGEKYVEVTMQPDLERMRRDIAVYSIDNEQTERTILDFHGRDYEVDGLHSTLEPHTAVGWRAAQLFREETGYGGKIITLGTAHPGKFPEVLKKHGIEPALPDCLARLVDVPHGATTRVANDYGAVKAGVQLLYRMELARQQAV